MKNMIKYAKTGNDNLKHATHVIVTEQFFYFACTFQLMCGYRQQSLYNAN